MRINKKLYSVTLASVALILFLILIPSAASAAPITITETQITTSGAASNPNIYDGKIVWEDDGGSNSNVYMYDLSTKKETKITTDDYGHYNPAIYDSKIVYGWVSNTEPDYGIEVYDLSTNKNIWSYWLYETYGHFYPAIYGSRIVWDGNGIWMHDLSDDTETQISSKYGSNPAIYEDKIVWTDGNVSMYDLPTKKETQITTSGSAYNPAIYGNRIVYESTHDGNTDIYLYDISTKKETQITSSPDAQTHPAIYGNRIVWEDDGGEDDGGEDDGYTNHGIYMYDISTNQKMKISAKGSAYNPAIYGNNIVWHYGSSEIGDIYMATLSSNLPVAAFSASPTSGNLPLKVQFSDKSTGYPTSWKWNFGDGKTSTAKNPAYTYTKAGKYTVSLTVKNAAGTNTKTIKDYITVKTAPVKPVAAFSASPTSGYAPLKVTFTDKSTNSPTSWKWSFGDGKTSTSKSPAYTYSKAGKYTVSLTVKNAAGSSSKTIKNYIVVNTLKAPVAAFYASPMSGKAPLNVQFTDKSTNSPTSWKWSFGDGTYSTAKNPVHKYSKVGKYTVSLTVKNAKGSNTKTISNYITVKK